MSKYTTVASTGFTINDISFDSTKAGCYGSESDSDNFEGCWKVRVQYTKGGPCILALSPKNLDQVRVQYTKGGPDSLNVFYLPKVHREL